MNREIKFRGKRKCSNSDENGNWVYGFYCKTVRYKLDVIISDSEYGIDPKTISQFTGLYDKNGKEIYEGDILDYPFRQVRDNNVVTFADGTFMLTDGRGQRFYPNNAEVIGNVHDNTGLLKTDEV
ncbi:MAG: YopX family protein [Prevotellaceae bacterium]|jgi:uncharacterized phage protein (TIGR01671 family)|nr:YopX family protein [Prevotellaceae bacterium]